MSLRETLPTSGPLGTLRDRSPALYALVIAVGTVAYVTVLLVAAYSVLLLPLVAARTIVSAASGSALTTLLWLLTTAAVVGLLVASVYGVTRWVGEATIEDD